MKTVEADAWLAQLRQAHQRSGPAARGADPAMVGAILDDVRREGDAAVYRYTARFDAVPLEQLQARGHRVSEATLEGALRGLDAETRRALQHAADNVRKVAGTQRAALRELDIDVEPGVRVQQRVEPVRAAACYVPGGRYPLPSSVLMTAIPAREAGVERVVVLTPPGPDGVPHPVTLAAAALAGTSEVFAIGGAQAIAAAAYGTATVAPVDLIVGPGNAWVTEAKRQVFGRVGIDSLAGPSEVMVLADGSADPVRLAADLLAQAEHDPLAEAVVVTADRALASAVSAEVARQLAALPTGDVARQSIAARGAVVLVPDHAGLARVANARAPEHLQLVLGDPEPVAAACHAYGALFIGEDSPEVFGDYCAGGNHVLPTGGAARYAGGLSVHTFVRVVTHQRVSGAGVGRLARTAATLARVEGLEAHARAADLRR